MAREGLLSQVRQRILETRWDIMDDIWFSLTHRFERVLIF